ncbi:hypothetical protein L195_g040828 [Trifolium pratense]|uniref:Uncharacterized protein n=1 Tax=Trifolium pratense TaxID=57577 RepID=A0A2K3M1V1_TRIPR|nr:hypothetical protein L195_g040828 [Trifolium pratense]
MSEQPSSPQWRHPSLFGPLLCVALVAASGEKLKLSPLRAEKQFKQHMIIYVENNDISKEQTAYTLMTLWKIVAGYMKPMYKD